LSGSPTIAKAGMPDDICTCTSIGRVSIPRKETVAARATMETLWSSRR
jgi:hypothetical protein